MSLIDINDGEAHIKPEFILLKESLKQKTENVPEPKKSESTDDQSTEPPTNQSTEPPIKDQSTEPPSKKQKLSGRNKKRPRYVKAPRSSKLCRNMWCLRVGEDAAGKCPYDKCQFSHDVEAFLKEKPEDKDSECHNYRTYGRCAYGLMCRFGGDHIEGSRNKVNEELWAKYENIPSVTNQLKREVQQKLWKRQYDFNNAIQAIREVQSKIDKNKAAQEKKKEKKDPSEVNEENSESNGNINENGQMANNNVEVKEGIVTESLESDTKEVHKSSGGQENNAKAIGPAADDDLIRLNSREKKKIDWRDKLYLAPLTTLGNLPFRRLCKRLGADITCGEMALASNLLQGSPSEWALVKRHQSEDLFGIQVCGNNAEVMVKCAELLNRETNVDFVDINMGCPIDLIYKQGGGSALMRRHGCLEQMVRGMTKVLSVPLTLKMRTAVYHDTLVAHKIMEKAKLWDVSMMTLHGRSKEQRYLKIADWNYISECVAVADPIPVFGNGDIFSYEDYNYQKKMSNVTGIMIGRGALIKPWIFKEIKEQKHWDISSSERYDILKEYTNYGLEHWGSDTEGIEKTRRFLLEWLSFMHRYIPVGVLEETQKINQRPPLYKGRNYLETLMISKSASDWIKISEMLLGTTPADFEFLPKHKANAY